MKHLFATLLIFIILTSTTVFAQDMSPTDRVESISNVIGEFMSGASPIILIGLGILLIFVQKLAKIAGIILLIIGVVRSIFMFL
jgi:hypothetical protein